MPASSARNRASANIDRRCHAPPRGWRAPRRAHSTRSPVRGAAKWRRPRCGHGRALPGCRTEFGFCCRNEQGELAGDRRCWVERQPLRKLEPDATALLRLIERRRKEVERAQAFFALQHTLILREKCRPPNGLGRPRVAGANESAPDALIGAFGLPPASIGFHPAYRKPLIPIEFLPYSLY
jgi:hypothetical protein